MSTTASIRAGQEEVTIPPVWCPIEAAISPAAAEVGAHTHSWQYRFDHPDDRGGDPVRGMGAPSRPRR
ncbi:hypothetical protein AB0K48_30400 [Nonomuraea sp. NPDC055795]